MSIIDFIKGLFGEEPNQSSNVVEDKSVNSDVMIDKTPTLENVARFVIKTRKSKCADIQRYFQIGYKLSGDLMSQLQQNGILDNANNVLVDTNISDDKLTKLLSQATPDTIDCHHVSSASGFEIKIISSSPINIESSIKTYIPGLSNYECYIVFDTETSGLSPQQGHEILQIGAVKYNTRTGETIDTRSIYIKPSPNCVIEPAALRVNGIDIEKLKQTGVSKGEAIKTFIEFIGSYPLFAYNAPFDMRFLKSTCEMVNVPLPTNPVCDVLAMVRKLSLPTENNKLGTISEHFGFTGGNYHEAIKDCDATNFVLRKIYFNEEGKPVGKSVDNIHLNLHKGGVALEPYIEQNMLELDVYSRLTGEYLFTKNIRQCAEKGIYVSYNTVKDLEGTLWTTDYGIRLHEESRGKLEPDIYYGKRIIDVYSRTTGEFLFTKTLEECASLASSLSQKKIANATIEMSWLGEYGFRAHEQEPQAKIERDFTYGKRLIDCYSKEGDFLKRYDSISDIVTELGFAGDSPIKTMLRQDKITYNLNGYIFIYATSEQPIQKIEGASLTKEAKRPIYVFDIDGNYLNVFLKITECTAAYGLQAEGVRRCLSAGKPQYNGYIFRYSNTPLSEEELAAAKENYAYRETSKVTN
ncbi:MAG: ribonuclease H-like domain-containing protein [Prevotella sp.]|nr:ribonuclease H-like domain-containing protein [Prevotella sp.]